MTFYHNWFRQLSIVNLPLDDRVRIEINFHPKSPRICRRILGVDADIVALVSKWFILDNSHYSTVRWLRCLWNSSLINMIFVNTRCPFYLHGLTLTPAWISYHIHHKMWNEITYPFPNFNGATIELWEWVNNFIPHFTGHINTCPFCD